MAFSKQYRNDPDSYPPSSKAIKQVSELLGMSDEGVRLYAQHGLVHPDVREGSRIRSFDVMDFVMLLYSRVYRNSGFSLKETEQIVESGDIRSIRRMYEAKIREKEEELARARVVLDSLHDSLLAMESIPSLVGRCETAPFPGLYRIEFMFSNGSWCENPEEEELISAWAGYAPCTMVSSRYSVRELIDGTWPVTVSAGMGMYAKHAAFFSVREGGPVLYVPPCDRAVHVILSADNSQLVPDMAPVVSYLTENRLEPADDAVTLGVVNMDFETTFTRFFHLWIPLK